MAAADNDLTKQKNGVPSQVFGRAFMFVLESVVIVGVLVVIVLVVVAVYLVAVFYLHCI